MVSGESDSVPDELARCSSAPRQVSHMLGEVRFSQRYCKTCVSPLMHLHINVFHFTVTDGILLRSPALPYSTCYTGDHSLSLPTYMNQQV